MNISKFQIVVGACAVLYVATFCGFFGPGMQRVQNRVVTGTARAMISGITNVGSAYFKAHPLVFVTMPSQKPPSPAK